VNYDAIYEEMKSVNKINIKWNTKVALVKKIIKHKHSLSIGRVNNNKTKTKIRWKTRKK
jgi:hypothetical protein